MTSGFELESSFVSATDRLGFLDDILTTTSITSRKRARAVKAMQRCPGFQIIISAVPELLHLS